MSHLVEVASYSPFEISQLFGGTGASSRLQIYFQIQNATVRPSQTNNNPNITFAPTFASALNSSPSRTKFIVSLPKEEKVVNPPSTPTKTSALVSEVNTPRASASWERNPITKQPIKLTVNVPKGKSMLLLTD